jgi:Fur family ferric uptake transcriptional regulator
MSHDIKTIAARLRRDGYRVTPQRQLILDAVCRSGGHVTAEAIYAAVRQIVPALNQGTVYRALNFFCEQGLVTATQQANGLTVYELAGHEPHHHLVCRACGATTEIPHEMLCPLFEQAQEQYGFAVEMNHISFFGCCADCRQLQACPPSDGG